MPVLILFFTILVVGVFVGGGLYVVNLSRRLAKLEREVEYVERGEVDRLLLG